jgi:hypothetical protein
MLEALSEIVVNWRDIDAPFTPANLARLLDAYAGRDDGVVRRLYQ